MTDRNAGLALVNVRGIVILDIEHWIADGPDFERRAREHWMSFLQEVLAETDPGFYSVLLPEPAPEDASLRQPLQMQRLYLAEAAVSYLENEVGDGLVLTPELAKRLAALAVLLRGAGVST